MTALLNVPIPSVQQLQQNCARLLQQSLQAAIQAARPADVSTADIDLARSNIKALAFVQGMGLHGVYRYLRDFIARQAVPIYSAGEFLRGWLLTYGMDFKAASAAQGGATGTGVPATVLPAGTLVRTDAGVQFKVVADVVVGAGGTVAAAFIAVVAGAGYVSAGTPLTLVSPVDGIDSTFTASAGWLPGVDVESESAAVYRLQQRLANAPMAGSPADYARWALQVSSITRAWGVRNPAGATTAGVIIMADGNPSGVALYGLPTASQRDEVYDYIADPMRGPPDELHVIIPTAVVIAPKLRISPDNAAVRAAVVAGLKDLFFREALPGGSLPHGHAIEVVSEAAGEYNHEWVSPSVVQGSIWTVPSAYHLLVLGDVTFVA
jgi:uncharacterized phage protein gp47/JayE